MNLPPQKHKKQPKYSQDLVPPYPRTLSLFNFDTLCGAPICWLMPLREGSSIPINGSGVSWHLVNHTSHTTRKLGREITKSLDLDVWGRFGAFSRE